MWLARDLFAANMMLPRYTRAQRGFINAVTGQHLCPVFLDYSDEMCVFMIHVQRTYTD